MKENNKINICKHCQGLGICIDMPCGVCKGLGHTKNRVK